jgi:guanine nucleotide-binding protein G(I)/G(S)/G(T) subunit beta-1
MAPVTLQQKANAAERKISQLTTNIHQTLASKRDQSLAEAARGTPLAQIRSNVKCRRTLKGHFGKITALDWTQDGTTIVSASQDGNLLLWDAVTTTKKQTVRLKSAYVMSACIEKEGRFVAAGGLDNACSVYRVGGDQAKLATELVSHEGYLADCKFFHSPSKMITASADATSLLWDVEKGQIIETFAGHKSNLTSVSLVEDGKSFLSASTDRSIKLWDVRTPKNSVKTLTGHAGDVNGITTLPGGNTLASCSEDGTVRVWDLRAYGEVSSFGNLVQPDNQDPFSDGDAGFTSIDASASGRLVFCGHSEGSVVAYDVLGATKDPAFVLSNAHEEYVSCVGVSPTGEALCTGSWDFNLKIFA